ncbi:hypothetical protein J2Z22_001096 [Paenibacillus forsythiae]|uniref:DUF3888 domain-containing protein n=1 Tax=Paenibacillus forsythiae TaxID=365616 RepID=A0ABU3H427_9BACL|nr:DUF3888 domain-containing protein [Paenibacillus forsythiae]MDT3425577.1 hypothetical protein [Paenibacillus forsythiae]
MHMKHFGLVILFVLILPSFVQAAGLGGEKGTPADDHGKRVILTLLSPYIQEELDRCYKGTKHPSVQFAPFLSDTVVVKMVYYSSHIEIELRVFPYVGPHLTIGEDELTFRIDNTGKVKGLGCRHIRDDFPLPWNYQSGSPALPGHKPIHSRLPMTF